MPELFAAACSITTTKRRRYFWAAWWTGVPTHVPFRKPDASGGGVSSREAALAAAEAQAGRTLVEIDPLWARAWMRVLRGQEAWPSKASREPHVTTKSERASDESIWSLLGVDRNVTEAELKAAYRKRALETHPDHGGDDETFHRIVRAYAEAQRRLRRPRRTGGARGGRS